MLVFLLKNGRLRLPVFLLVLVIGMELLPSAAPLQCYECSGEKCRTDFKASAKIKTCGPDLSGTNTTSCSSYVTATTASRNCEALAFSKVCAEEAFKRSCFAPGELTNPGFNDCRLKKLTGGSVARSNDMNQASGGNFCFCDTDLCNDGEEVVKIDVGGGNPSPPIPTGPGGDGSGGGPPTEDNKKSDNGTATGGPYSSFNTFGVLFFAVLGAFVSAGSVMVRL